MSLDLYVLLKQSALPSSKQWSEAIRQEGFNINLDQSFDTKESCGFCPCLDSSRGFEYSLSQLNMSDIEHLNMSSQEEEEISKFDTIIGLHYKTEADIEVVNAAAAVLAKMVSGVVIEAEAGAIIKAEDALAWANGEYEPMAREFPINRQKKQSELTVVNIFKLVSLVSILLYWAYVWATR